MGLDRVYQKFVYSQLAQPATADESGEGYSYTMVAMHRHHSCAEVLADPELNIVFLLISDGRC